MGVAFVTLYRPKQAVGPWLAMDRDTFGPRGSPGGGQARTRACTARTAEAARVADAQAFTVRLSHAPYTVFLIKVSPLLHPGCPPPATPDLLGMLE